MKQNVTEVDLSVVDVVYSVRLGFGKVKTETTRNTTRFQDREFPERRQNMKRFS